LRNLWLAEGFSFGITAAGGTGHYLAQMMTKARPKSTWPRSTPSGSADG
jgi:glycine/D-amino acid oxidase-like deaminating enzyme